MQTDLNIKQILETCLQYLFVGRKKNIWLYLNSLCFKFKIICTIKYVFNVYNTQNTHTIFQIYIFEGAALLSLSGLF